LASEAQSLSQRRARSKTAGAGPLGDILRPLNDFFHFARPQATRADTDAADFPFKAHFHALNVWRPTAVGNIMCVADIVPEDRRFRADLTFLSHNLLPRPKTMHVPLAAAII
jgi:hypothetical protein